MRSTIVVHVCMSIARASRVLCVIHWFAMHSPLQCSATLATLAQAEHSCGSGQRHLPALISGQKRVGWDGSERRKQRTPRWNARCVDTVALATRHVGACVHSRGARSQSRDAQNDAHRICSVQGVRYGAHRSVSRHYQLHPMHNARPLACQSQRGAS